MLQWARAQQLPCPWDGDTWDAAIQQEPHEVVQWLRVHGCPEELEWRDDYYDEHWCGGGLHARTTLINSSMRHCLGMVHALPQRLMRLGAGVIV